MRSLTVYDPPMCCSTGVCGPSPEPALPRFAADLDWLSGQGVQVTRYNFSQNPGAFAENTLVRSALKEQGNECLPLIVVDGTIVSTGTYPDRNRLAAFVGLADTGRKVTLDSPEVKELVAIGASIAANCLACFKFHHDRAIQLGLSADDISRAVNMALAVKKTAGEHVMKLADSTLNPAPKVAGPASCCGGKPSSGGSCCG